ncbi:SPW repeat protein [Paenibacillus cellulositrophicus]|uniref:Flp pilus assembly protein protease CpaA n=2 Tax=Paenibacillus TaxID=44249 RepID=A0A839TH28_9BACL|nr:MULTISPECIES: SPW repeat protein [Paenibacillus]MBB3125813.1 Flp pilus assembly protein protease CpaA [Paenibacillus rhizosphaerae]MBJ9990149.1 SPW repeat protein [Paenibacillus sp. S28]MCM2997311.1 SPW repeat protein [Paenibacillus cellulositrophicus]MEC0174715.1 SPW repeat protein [Paenibacillus favisporus]PQP89684.1 hypothetical protein CPT76_16955 [Paenibacillus sp. AR247]
MKLRSVDNTIVALIGIWFIIAPWIFGFSDDNGALWTSVIIGAVQLIASLWAFSSSGWGSWQNWISLLAGVWFIVFPFVYSVDTSALWTSIILGAVTVLLNLITMGAKD